MSIPQPDRSSGTGCWKIGLISCGVVSVLVIAAMLVMGYFAAKLMPDAKQMGVCTVHMTEIQGALERYKTRHNSYPSNLNELSPTFLSKSSALKCPLDKTGSSISYIYITPAVDAPGTTIILKCPHHQMMGNIITLCMQKDGKMGPPETRSGGAYPAKKEKP